MEKYTIQTENMSAEDFAVIGNLLERGVLSRTIELEPIEKKSYTKITAQEYTPSKRANKAVDMNKLTKVITRTPKSLFKIMLQYGIEPSKTNYKKFREAIESVEGLQRLPTGKFEKFFVAPEGKEKNNNAPSARVQEASHYKSIKQVDENKLRKLIGKRGQPLSAIMKKYGVRDTETNRDRFKSVLRKMNEITFTQKNDGRITNFRLASQAIEEKKVNDPRAIRMKFIGSRMNYLMKTFNLSREQAMKQASDEYNNGQKKQSTKNEAVPEFTWNFSSLEEKYWNSAMNMLKNCADPKLKASLNYDNTSYPLGLNGYDKYLEFVNEVLRNSTGISQNLGVKNLFCIKKNNSKIELAYG